MKKTYNQSELAQQRQTTFNPVFWEVHFDQESLARLPTEAALHYESEHESRARLQREQWIANLIPLVRQVMAQTLTLRQCQIVELYFFEGKTETEIAGHLQLSAATVSQHLFGKKRGEKYIGGAIPKLRKRLAGVGGPIRAAEHP